MGWTAPDGIKRVLSQQHLKSEPSMAKSTDKSARVTRPRRASPISFKTGADDPAFAGQMERRDGRRKPRAVSRWAMQRVSMGRARSSLFLFASSGARPRPSFFGRLKPCVAAMGEAVFGEIFF